MQHFVTMITFRKMFFTNIFEERIIFLIWVVIENVMDLFCFYLKSLALNMKE